MRSYSYSNGIWQEVVDPFPTIASSLGDAFSDALKRQGFGTFEYTTRRFDCALGRLILYARDHEQLGFTRKEKEFQYDFLCVLSIPDTSIRVWIPDLPSLFLFFREVEVRHDQEEDRLPDLMEKFFYDADVQLLISAARYLADDLREKGLIVRTSSPKPPQRRP